jgi:integrase
VTGYLRVRRSHKMARFPALWLGSRNRGPMTGPGVYQMLDRRAEEAGYDPQAVHPHMFRHTVANDWWRAAGSEGDLMRLMGWHDRSMVRRRHAGPARLRRQAAARRHVLNSQLPSSCG